MKVRSIKIILLIALLLICFASEGLCSDYDFEYGSETIFEDTTWSGTVFIHGVLTVFEKATLTIEPGTVIMFKKVDSNGNGFGENEMYVRGKIIAEGTKEKPITFTSAEDDKKQGDWIAVNMMLSDERKNIFKNCIIEYSFHGLHAHYADMNIIDSELRYNFLAVQFQDSRVTIERCSIHDNNQAIQFRDSMLDIKDTKIAHNNIGIRCVFSQVNFDNNEIVDCTMPAFQIRGSEIKITNSKLSGSKAGLTAQDSEIDISHSMILDNMQDGLSLHNSDITIKNNYIMLNGDDGVLIEHCTAVINNNNIFNNAKYNVGLEQEGDVDARYNYWGSADIDRINVFNYDKGDLKSLGSIDVDGYHKSEITIK